MSTLRRIRSVEAPETMESGKGSGDLNRGMRSRCTYCLDPTDEKRIRVGLGMSCRVCKTCKEKRGIK